MIHYHGTPITPASVLEDLAGRHFCVSYASPRQVSTCHRIGQSVMLDNGAFTFWTKKRQPDWPGYMVWAEEWLDFPTTWAVIPDVIDGSEEENDALLETWALPKGAPVWHLCESFNRLRALASEYERICFGSSGLFATVGTESWHRRVSEAFDVLADERGRVPWVHMLRGMSLSGGIYPFASVDSTDVARNHNRPRNTAKAMAERWDGMQCPARWGHQTKEEPCSVTAFLRRS